MTIPYSVHPKQDHEILLDFQLRIPLIHSNNIPSQKDAETTSLDPEAELTALLEASNACHRRIKNQMASQGVNSGSDFVMIDVLRSLACIAIGRKMTRLAPNKPLCSDLDMDLHCRFILSCAPHIKTAATYSRTLHIMYAIHLVAIYAESEMLREEALEKFAKWQQTLTATNL